MRKLTDTMNLALSALYALQSTCTDPSADKAWGIGSVAPGQDPNRSCRALVKRGVALELDPDSGERREGTGSYRLTELGLELGAERAMVNQAEADRNSSPELQAEVTEIFKRQGAGRKASVLQQVKAAHDAERELVAPSKLSTDRRWAIHRKELEGWSATPLKSAAWAPEAELVDEPLPELPEADELADYQGEQQAEADAAVVAEYSSTPTGALGVCPEAYAAMHADDDQDAEQHDAHVAEYESQPDDCTTTVAGLYRSVAEQRSDYDPLKVVSLGEWSPIYREAAEVSRVSENKAARAAAAADGELDTVLFEMDSRRWKVA